MFCDTLTELERLVEVRGKILDDRSKVTLKEVIFHKLKLLTESDVNTSESNAIEDLERLATLKEKTKFQNLRDYSYSRNLDAQQKFDKLIDSIILSKIDFIKKGSFSRLVSRGGVEPMAALERLAEIPYKIGLDMYDLLELKMRQVMDTPEAKASPTTDLFIGQVIKEQCLY